MSKPLGRDRLGRLVYEGDVLVNKIGGGFVAWYPHLSDEWDFFAYCLQFDVVDLEKSPKHSNFERYFADLGTLEEVMDGFRDCRGISCYDCPFRGWNRAFGMDYSFPSQCTGFPKWLGEVAAV